MATPRTTAPSDQAASAEMKELRTRASLLLSEYLEVLHLLPDESESRGLLSDRERDDIFTRYLERQDECLLAATPIENGLIQHGSMERVVIQTAGLTLIKITWNGQEQYVSTLSLTWWRVVCRELRLALPVGVDFPPARETADSWEWWHDS